MDGTSVPPERPPKIGAWVKLPAAAVDALPSIGTSAFAVLGSLASYANDAGECWLKIETIAQRVGMKERAVQLAIGVLSNAGLIGVERRPGRATTFRINYAIQGGAPACAPGAHVDAPRGAPACARGRTYMRPGAHVDAPLTRCTKQDSLNETQGTKKSRRAPAADVPIPSSLDSLEFRAAWQDWQQHRREIRKPLTPTATTAQLKTLDSMGPARAVAAIRHSIASGWTGIFEASANRPTQASPNRCGPGAVYDPHAKERNPNHGTL